MAGWAWRMPSKIHSTPNPSLSSRRAGASAAGAAAPGPADQAGPPLPQGGPDDRQRRQHEQREQPLVHQGGPERAHDHRVGDWSIRCAFLASGSATPCPLPGRRPRSGRPGYPYRAGGADAGSSALIAGASARSTTVRWRSSLRSSAASLARAAASPGWPRPASTAATSAATWPARGADQSMRALTAARGGSGPATQAAGRVVRSSSSSLLAGEQFAAAGPGHAERRLDVVAAPLSTWRST